MTGRLRTGSAFPARMPARTSVDRSGSTQLSPRRARSGRTPGIPERWCEDSPGWNEALSLSRAGGSQRSGVWIRGLRRGASTRPTPYDPSRPGASAEDGRTQIVVLPEPTDRICGPLAPNDQVPVNGCDEPSFTTGSMRRAESSSKRTPASGRTPACRFAGIRAAGEAGDGPVVQGVEIATHDLRWEVGVPARAAERLIASSGRRSDKHSLDVQTLLPACPQQSAAGYPRRREPWLGADGGYAAVDHRLRCANALATTHAPTTRLEYEIRNEPADAPIAMGSIVSARTTRRRSASRCRTRCRIRRPRSIGASSASSWSIPPGTWWTPATAPAARPEAPRYPTCATTPSRPSPSPTARSMPAFASSPATLSAASMDHRPS